MTDQPTEAPAPEIEALQIVGHEAELKQLDADLEHARDMAKAYRHHGGNLRLWMPWSAYGAPIEHQANRRAAIIAEAGARPPRATKALLGTRIDEHDGAADMPHEPLRRLYRRAHQLRGPAADAVAARRAAHEQEHGPIARRLKLARPTPP